jgi:hypothetical protein
LQFNRAANEGSLAERFKCKVYDLTAKLFCILIVQPEEHHPGPLNDLIANDTYNQNASADGPDKPRFKAPWRLNSDRVSPTTVTKKGHRSVSYRINLVFLGIPPRRMLKHDTRLPLLSFFSSQIPWHRLRHELSRHGGQQKARSHYLSR